MACSQTFQAQSKFKCGCHVTIYAFVAVCGCKRLLLNLPESDIIARQKLILEEQMQKFAIAIGLLLSVLFLTGSTLHAEASTNWHCFPQIESCKTLVDSASLLTNFK